MCVLITSVHAQTVWENYRSEEYPYLYRMAQKGLVEFSDLIQPVSREDISTRLLQLDSTVKIILSPNCTARIKELDFYLKEYRPIAGTDAARLKGIQRDANKRLRGLFYHGKDFQLYADPFGSIMRVSGGGKNFTQMSQGFQFLGKAGKFGFQFYYRDYTETGSGIDSFRKESPETGMILQYNEPCFYNSARVMHAWQTYMIAN